MSVAKRNPSQFFLSPVNLGGLALLTLLLLVGVGTDGAVCAVGGAVGMLAGLGTSGGMSFVPFVVRMTMAPTYPAAEWKGSINSPTKVCRVL